MIDVALLGTGGMMPLPNRWLASAALRIEGEVILFDCGEGTQISNRLHGFGFRGGCRYSSRPELDLCMTRGGLPGRGLRRQHRDRNGAKQNESKEIFHGFDSI